MIVKRLRVRSIGIIGLLILLMCGCEININQLVGWEDKPDFAKSVTTVIDVADDGGILRWSLVLGFLILAICVDGKPLFWRTPRSCSFTISLIAILLAGYFLWFGQDVAFSCERSKAICTLSRTAQDWSKTQSFSVQALKGAYVRTITDTDNDGARTYSYAVAIVIDRTEIRLSRKSDSSEAQKTVDRMNAFIQRSGQESVTIEQFNHHGSWVVAVILILISLVAFGVGCFLRG